MRSWIFHSREILPVVIRFKDLGNSLREYHKNDLSFCTLHIRSREGHRFANASFFSLVLTNIIYQQSKAAPYCTLASS